jgi:hypothetical protein
MELGKARASDVRPIVKARYRESTESSAPGASTLRLTGRRSLCEDPRVVRTDYDFDAGGTLQRVTAIWTRPALADVTAAMTRFATMKPRSVGGRTVGTTEYYNFAIEDRPQEQVLAVNFTPLGR